MTSAAAASDKMDFPFQSKERIYKMIGRCPAHFIVTAILSTFSAFLDQAHAEKGPPTYRFNAILDHCKLQLPVAASDGKNAVMEIDPLETLSHSSPFFHSDERGDLVFVTPDDGATTWGTHYPRTELRSLEEWDLHGGGVHGLHGDLSITKQPTSGKIVFAQVHGPSKGSEALKILWDRGSLILEVKTTLGERHGRIEVATGLRLGDEIVYDIRYQTQRLFVTIADKRLEFAYDNSWSGQHVYFKAGDYLQDDSAMGREGEVVYKSLTEH